MRRIMVLWVAAAAVSLSATSAGASTNLVRNGSFEKPGVGGGSFKLFSTGQDFSNWTVVGATGNVGIVSGTFSQEGFTFPAKAGLQWLDLTGTTKSATGVSQVLSTTPAASYTLSFFVGNVVDPTGIFGTSSTVDVLVDGSQVLEARNSGGKGRSTQTWKKFTLTIVATLSKTTISFMNGDPSNDDSNGLDAVKLTPVA